MARVPGLREEVEEVFDKSERRKIKLLYLANKYFYVVGLVVGISLGFLLQNLDLLIFFVLAISAFCYFWIDIYLLKQDGKFFNSAGHSKQEIFDRYYAKEISRQLSLRFTTPQALVSQSSMSLEERRADFKRVQAKHLENEFYSSDWRYFVAQVIHYD
ncbi:hypothetical protein [Massilia sp.]|uniref:hypothetical protein n=1 Tax=Massilia sp. TaxID=1882437 RepID=UPI0028979079|nr:hypothetical protein [Massilia sp.]